MTAQPPAVEAPPWRPVIFDPGGSAEDRARLRALRGSRAVWSVTDTIEAQLRDLVRARAAARPADADATAAQIARILDGRASCDYGRWVYYPWSGRLVHLLPPGQFRELRLDRNRPKITAEEQERLRGFAVGIAGLSVGNAIAVTLAQEGAAGHLRLADFDRLELSNMNRIRAAVSDIGLPKTVLAARQIAEVDPYVEISVMRRIARDNVEEFLLGGPELGPPLSAVVDECDSVEVKFLLRRRARARRLPVLMETSDRGMLDVERFDLEPDRPLFHGLLGPDADDTGAPEAADERRRLATVLSLLDPQRMSSPLAASFLEVGSTLSSWPQLASDVVLGGASATVAVRRLALGAPLPSGRRRVDLGAAVAAASETPVAAGAARPPLLPSAGRARPRPVAAVPAHVRELVGQAVLAPSAANSQPWHFRWDGRRLLVELDRERGANLMDPHFAAAYLALGAAVENISLAAHSRGLLADVEPFPPGSGGEVVAAVRITASEAPVDPALATLACAIPHRRTDRSGHRSAEVTAEECSALQAAAAGFRGALTVCTGRSELARLGNVLGACDRLRFLNPHLHAELIGELRFGLEERTRSDGIGLSHLGLPPEGELVVQLLARPDVSAQLRRLGGGRRLAELTASTVEGAAAMGLLSLPGNASTDWLAGGRAMQRVWLRAQVAGLAVHPMATPVFMFALLREPARCAEIFDAAEVRELEALRQQFCTVFRAADPAERAGPPALLLRLGRADTPARPSPRLPVDWVLSCEANEVPQRSCPGRHPDGRRRT